MGIRISKSIFAAFVAMSLLAGGSSEAGTETE